VKLAALLHEIDLTLVSAFHRLDEWFDVLPQLRAYRPQSGGWSIDEILEHVALTNHFLLILIEKGASKAIRNINQLDLATELSNYRFERDKLNDVGRHKSFPWVRPEHMEPNGEKTSAEVRNTLHEQLAQCQAVLSRLAHGEGVLYRTSMSVNDLGKLDVYEFVFFLAKHAERHLTQIANAAAEYQQQS